MTSSRRLILASASPRRRELLHAAGYDFLVHPANVDEEDYPPATLPADLALHLARLKADAVAQRFSEDVVLAADTVVAFGDQVLGKPANPAQAEEMLLLLSGTAHVVISGVAVVCLGQNHRQSDRVLSCVRMKRLTQSQIDNYVAGGQWEGKAGGYGIQDDDPFVTRMSGCHTNIVGLPMTTTRRLLSEAGIFPKQQ